MVLVEERSEGLLLTVGVRMLARMWVPGLTRGFGGGSDVVLVYVSDLCCVEGGREKREGRKEMERRKEMEEEQVEHTI